MSIIKNDIPILEYDTDKSQVINPTHENLNIKLPKLAVFAFLDDCIDKFAKENHAVKITEFVSITKNYPIYIVDYKCKKICLVQAPVGASASTQIMDWLIGYGVEKIISAGSCGSLKSFKENTFLIPYKALRDEGTSYHYLPPSRYVDLNPMIINSIKKVFSKHQIPYNEVITWSTDGFYRETKEKVEYRKSEGCAVVEMECSALASCAEFRSAVFGMILYTADSLADINNYDERNWGENSKEIVLQLCFEVISNL